ncbi:MAG: hypothetical protein HY329_18110 [Chloroflexi bacterium]|nr:hypothetical protein [Chloroflexota bacterium]
MTGRIVGLFPDRKGAELAAVDLAAAGFTAHQIRIVTREDLNAPASAPVSDELGVATSGPASARQEPEQSGSLAGAATGGTLGAMAGPVGAILGAVGGALVGGQAADGEERSYYDHCQRGGAAVHVNAGERLSEATAILEENGAEIRTLSRMKV